MKQIPINKFQVVKIISSYQIVINAGLANGIKIGDIFEIGQSVTDPDTGESLGTLDFIKAKVSVTHVFSKMCICENAKTIFTDWDFSINSRVVLNVNPEEISGGYGDDCDPIIRLGDGARLSS